MNFNGTDHHCVLINPQTNQVSTDDFFKHGSKNGHNNNCSNEIKFNSNDIDSNIVKEAIDSVGLLLCNRFSQNPFYFVFDEVSKSNKVCKTENCNGNNNSIIDLTSSSLGLGDSDVSLRKERNDSNSSNENQSVFGSPLKLQTFADLSSVNGIGNFTSTPTSQSYKSEQIQGLSCQRARLVLSKFIEIKEQLSKSIVILCDGKDPKKTILLGAYREEKGGKIKLRTVCATLKSLDKMKLSSLQALNSQNGEEYQMNADYEMLDKRDSMGSMLLQAKWFDRHGLPRISNIHSAQFSLKLAAISGFPDSPMYPYCNQLEEVRLLLKALRADKTPLTKENCDFDAASHLQQLFTKIEKGDESGLMSMNCDHGTRINLSPQRVSDFTDKIWIVVQQCASYEDMLTCLKMTLSALKNRAVSGFVHKDNQTVLAQFVRQSSVGMATFPPLKGALPLKMIVEIGLEKIRKDYVSVLVENALCSKQFLENFMKECQRGAEADEDENSSSYDDTDNVSAWRVELVEKLHHCLELACMLDSYSEHLGMSALVTAVLGHYKTQKLDESHTFTIPLSTKEAILQVQNLPANMIRREYVVGKDYNVDCYMSELPENLAFPIRISQDSSSSVLSESKEYYAFQTREHTKIF